MEAVVDFILRFPVFSVLAAAAVGAVLVAALGRIRRR